MELQLPEAIGALHAAGAVQLRKLCKGVISTPMLFRVGVVVPFLRLSLEEGA